MIESKQAKSEAQSTKFGIGSSKKGLHIALNFGRCRLPSGGGEFVVFLHEDAANDSTRVAPLVNDLVEHASVGMLRGEAQPKQFEAHARDFFDEQADVREPPATEDMQIT